MGVEDAELDRAPKRCDRLRVAPLVDLSQAQPEMGLGIVGIDRQYLAKVIDGLVGPVHLVVHPGQLAAYLSGQRIQPVRSAELPQALLQAASTRQEVAVPVVSGGVARVCRDRLAKVLRVTGVHERTGAVISRRVA